MQGRCAYTQYMNGKTVVMGSGSRVIVAKMVDVAGPSVVLEDVWFAVGDVQPRIIAGPVVYQPESGACCLLLDQAVACGMFRARKLERYEHAVEVLHLSKREIIDEAIRLGLRRDDAWACYTAGPTPCGECPSCLQADEAWREADGGSSR